MDMFKKIKQNIWGPGLLVFVPYTWLVLFLLIPMIYVISVSFTQPIMAVPPYEPMIRFVDDGLLQIQIYFENYAILFEDIVYVYAYMTSFKLAAITTFVSLLLGYPMAFAITKTSPKQQIFLLLLILLPFWTSFLLRLYAWMGLLSSAGIINTALMSLGVIERPLPLLYNDFSICVGMIYCYLPFMVLPLYASLSQLSSRYIEAAYDLGCRPFQVFWHVMLPLTRKGIITGSLFVFIPASGEFIIPELLGNSGTLMIGRVLWSEFFTNRDWSMAAALAMVLMTSLLLIFLFLQKREDR